MRVVVVGGGISGLAAAWALADRADVLVLEASPQVGGKLRVDEVAGLPVDVGAEAMLARRPEGVALARAAGLAGEPGCEVELTEIRTRGQAWWTLGFEAPGPAGLLRSELQATAAHVFAQPLPGAAEPGTDDSRSYAEWLGADSDADA